MIRITTSACACCVLVSCLTDIATAQRPRSSVVIGELDSPFGVDFDKQGDMYIVELSGGRVHKLDAAGTFTTIAGDGSEDYSGDNGPAEDATFNGMHNVAVTPSGDLYIADSWNHCIRKIDGETGIITTFAGTGDPGFGGDGGPASEAEFDFLMCVSLNATNDKLYLADLKNRRIRMVDLETSLVTTIAGNGQRGIPADGTLATESPLVDPRAVAVDSQNNVYILERSGHALRMVTTDGEIHTVAGTGQAGGADGDALTAQLNSPKHLAIDLEDHVIIADDQNRRIPSLQSRQCHADQHSGKRCRDTNERSTPTSWCLCSRRRFNLCRRHRARPDTASGTAMKVALQSWQEHVRRAFLEPVVSTTAFRIMCGIACSEPVAPRRVVPLSCSFMRVHLMRQRISCFVVNSFSPGLSTYGAKPWIESARSGGFQRLRKVRMSNRRPC